MPRTATATAYTYVDCARCGKGIPHEFSRWSGPVTYVHDGKERGRDVKCRLLVWPDPRGANDQVVHVPDDVSLAKALTSAMHLAHRHGWTMSHQFGADFLLATTAA